MATNGDVMDVGLAHQGELDSFRLRLGFWLWLLTHYDQIDDRKDAEVTFYPCITIQHYWIRNRSKNRPTYLSQSKVNYCCAL